MEIRVARAGDVPSQNDMADSLLIFNELLDLWNASERMLYSTLFATHTLTANLQPHTIGLAANAPTFSVSVGRPVRIINANIILNNNIRVPLDILTDEEWNEIAAGAATGQAVTITSSVPTVLWYKSGWPNGSIYLWPVPSTAYGLELQTETLLAAVALTDTFDLPFGYQAALRLTLAEAIAAAWGQTAPPSLEKRAMDARNAVWSNNEQPPTLTVWDGGLPCGARGGLFNFRTGQLTEPR